MLKQRLFSRGYDIKIEHREEFPHFKEVEVMDSWQKKESTTNNSTEDVSMKFSFFKKFFLFSVGFFILALLYGAYVFFGSGNTVSNDNIDIFVESSAFTAGGEEYSLLLEIVNRNNAKLQLADLVIEYPKSAASNLSQDSEYIRLSLGDIASGESRKENVKFVLFGEQGSLRQIKMSLEYRVEGSNAIFVKEKIYEVSISSTPISMLLDAPTSAVSNQDFNFNVKTILNATKPMSKVLLKVEYPIGFQFVRSNPMPSLGNSVWNLGDLAPGAEKNISITGRMIDVFDGEEKIFRVRTGSQSSGDKADIDVVFNSLEHNVVIQKSSLETVLVINGMSGKEYAVDTRTSIQAEIKWKNNLDTKISNLKIAAKLSGNALNRKTIQVKQGFYNSSTDTIMWDRNSMSDFTEISPGETGSVIFSLSPSSLFSASGGMLSSPMINIEVYSEGEQDRSAGSLAILKSNDSKSIKIISDFSLNSKALYYSGSFVNSGPVPPKVGQKTTYTILWTLSNTSNNISRTEVRATLPVWVNFLNRFNPGAENLSYNPSTREIVWNVGGLSKGTGVAGPAKEVSFQVELTPSLSQVGIAPILLNESILTGHDDFANVDLRSRRSALDTRALNDSVASPGGGIVIE